MSGGYLSPEEAARRRLEEFFNALSRDGERRRPLDPRCHSCWGNAVDVGVEGSIKFVQRHGRQPRHFSHFALPPARYHLSVWHSHICPQEGESTMRRDNDGKIILPDWVTPTTPYFIYSRTEAPEHLGDNPVILRVFIRPCSLCGAKDPFGYIALYLSESYTEQSVPHDFDTILFTPPPSVCLAKEDPKQTGESEIALLKQMQALQAANRRAEEIRRMLQDGVEDEPIGPLIPNGGKGLTPEQLFQGIKTIPRAPDEEAAKIHPNGTDIICLKCDRQQPKTHKFCVGCGAKLVR